MGIETVELFYLGISLFFQISITKDDLPGAEIRLS